MKLLITLGNLKVIDKIPRDQESLVITQKDTRRLNTFKFRQQELSSSSSCT